MKKKKIYFKNSKVAYYSITNIRTDYYKSKVNKSKLVKRIRINKDKFFRELKRLK